MREQRTVFAVERSLQESWRWRLLLIVPLLVVLLALSGCREDEKDRVLNYEKGTYLGPPDTELNAETLHELRQRAQYQRVQ